MKYIAFLRGINVGGHNKIKMEVLKKIFISIGYKNVKTVIQSGNVIFETSDKSIKSITLKIESKLYEFVNKEINAFVRTHEDLLNIVQQSPFGGTRADDKIKTYVFFLYKEPEKKLKLPLNSPNKEVSVFQRINLNLFMFVKKIPGKASSPNDFIEKTFGVLATARNWNVVCSIVEKASIL
jgi:uncharacterized protein (DUF1697 family)